MGDELADLFGGAFQVTHRPNNPDAPHPRFSQYKSRGYGNLSQKDRQKEFLSRQKQRRTDFLLHVRRLAENTWDEKEEEEEDEEEMETQATKRPGRRYKDQLLLSEWMLEVPPDFREQWLMVPCPVGRRNLVVASQGYTKSYHRNGYVMNTFRSRLPGGCKNNAHWKQNSTVLDCVFVESLQTYFVLDLMSWKDHPVYDTETEFRFYWAATKFAEHPEITEITDMNKYKFVLLPNYPCTQEGMENVMKGPLPEKLDGMLFYHKSTRYTFGPSPLVLWLKAYMMPELLGVNVPETIMQEAPPSYQNFAHHVQTVDREEYSRPREWKRGERKSNMETETAAETSTISACSKANRKGKDNKCASMDTTLSEQPACVNGVAVE